MKIFGTSNPSFVEVFDDVLTSFECDLLISEFDKQKAYDGMVGRDGQPLLDSEHKKCKQLKDSDITKSGTINSLVSTVSVNLLKKYFSKYQEQFSHYTTWSVYDEYSFQKYEDETDGYKAWHCEHGGGSVCSSRVLAWMVYLNDAKSGTEFLNYPKVNAKKGRGVVWPAFWTHVHRSELPNKGLKYIITGWANLDQSNIKYDDI